MNEAEKEQLIDRRVQRRIGTDAAYRNAANAEEQAEREREITLEVERGAYDLSDPKHPDHHDVYSDVADRGDF